MSDAEEPRHDLIYIAATLREAQQVEAVLAEHGIDYEVRVEPYRAGIIFASVRAGAFFYVPVEAGVRSRRILSELGYRVQEPA